jgi:hypothetical protein
VNAFITYGSDHFAKARERAVRQAQEMGVWDITRGYTPADIDAGFRQRNSGILSQPRGGGYWLYKSYFVNRTLAELQDGDVIMYSDAGCRFKGSAAPWIALAREHGWLGFRLEPFHPTQRWTKGDVFVALGTPMSSMGRCAKWWAACC